MGFTNLTSSTIAKLSDIIYLSKRPVPEAPDGCYRENSSQHSRLYNALDTIQTTVKRGPPPLDAKTIEGIWDTEVDKDSFDDRTNFFNRTLSALSNLPAGQIKEDVNDQAITTLWNTLTHPPATFLGHQFRKPDGSYNSLENPSLGQSGTYYARSVQSTHPQPLYTLPDPGLVFDTLLKARDFKEHPGRNSAMTFAYAAIVTHSLFRTDSKDQMKNNATSYLDLSPLYGNSELDQDLIRDKTKGLGYLYPDTFSEDRILFLPPAASVLLVLFSRNHNYIADMLLKINERGTWSNPPPTDPKKRAQQDEEIFQTARLVNCGHFMSMIFGDYVAGFLGTIRAGNPWTLQAFQPIKQKDGSELPRGIGNHVSVEFNLLYRWHATTAKEDITWTEEEFERLFSGKPLSEVDLNDFRAAALVMRQMTAAEPKERTFGGMKRNDDGTFNDDDLAKICHDATEKCGGAYRARGIPESFRVLEIMSMVQARQWGCCTMNEFRAFLGLKTFSSFKEWNPDPEIAEAAEKLYDHIDNLELYPGLQAEQTIPLGPGSGICCGYTMTRAILGDAISLVRGDRFYSTDYTPRNLTAWGYQDAARNTDNGAYGAQLPKLLMRHLPNHYPANSSYSLFPFFIPSEAEKNLKALGVADQYTFSRPPDKASPTKVLNTLKGIKSVLDDSKKFKAAYGRDMKMVTNDSGFFLVFDDQTKHEADKKMILQALFPSKDSMPAYAQWYKEETQALIKQKAFKHSGVPGTYIDIVQDVINLVSVHWAAGKLCGIPLKTNGSTDGIFTEEELSNMFSILFSCVFENTEPENGWTLQLKAAEQADRIKPLIEQSLNEVSRRRSLFNPVQFFGAKAAKILWPKAAKDCHEFLSRVASSGRPTKELVANVLGLAIQSSVSYSKAIAQIVDFYMDDKYAAERAEIISLSAKDDEASMELLRGYIREAMRLNPDFAGLYRSVVQDAVIDQGPGQPEINVKQGDLVYASFRNAHINPVDFPNPEQIDPRRPKDSYQLQGAGFYHCLGVSFIEETVPEMIKVIFRLPKLRRAAGPQGVLNSFLIKKLETDNKMYVNPTGTCSSWPGSLFLVYGDDLP